jgi:hypothetical protein
MNTCYEMGTMHLCKYWQQYLVSYCLSANVKSFKVIISVCLLIISRPVVSMILSYLTSRQVTWVWTIIVFRHVERSVWPSTQSWEHDETDILQWSPSSNKPVVERVWGLFSWFLVQVKIIGIFFKYNSRGNVAEKSGIPLAPWGANSSKCAAYLWSANCSPLLFVHTALNLKFFVRWKTDSKMDRSFRALNRV